jgi:hypothetical protein
VWREALPLFEVRYRALYTPRNHRDTPTIYTYSHDMIEKLVFCRTGPYLTRRATIGRLEPPLGSNCLAEGGSFATPYEPPESRGLEVRLAPT